MEYFSTLKYSTIFVVKEVISWNEKALVEILGIFVYNRKTYIGGYNLFKKGQI